jgi:ABC-type dipeptide/oligopeptide/nickel transport system permease component
VVLISAAFVLFNFFVDLVYAVLDPRIRYGTVSA